MARKFLFAAATLLCASLAHADDAPRATDADGFTEPLKALKFNPGLDQREFERSTLTALNVYDPLENMNRRLYHFNYKLDEWVLLPAVNGYTYITPKFLRTGVSNFFNNIGDVGNLVNSLLQLKGKRSLDTGGRVLLNTTVGIFGLWDPATYFGIKRQPEDFGQTLGYYGMPAGPYLVLPAFGPSNLRDTTGLVFDFAVESQINFLNVSQASSDYPEIYLLRTVDRRYQTPFRYGQLNSPFEYEKVRYIYTESRKLQIAE